MIRFLLAIAVIGCGGSPGKLANERRDPSTFVTEHQAMLVATGGGLVRIGIDGSGREQLTGARYHLEAATADGRVLVLGDSNTNLYIYDVHQPRQVHELDNRVGEAAISPDGSHVAVARHADFSLPQASWPTTEDDAIYLVDTKSLAVEIIPKARDELVTSLWWEADGKALILGMFNFDSVRLDLASRQREKLAERPRHPGARIGNEHCERSGETLELRGWKGDEGIDVVTATGTRRLVVIEGRSRGFHDYQSTIASAEFTPSCRYVVFEFGRSVWVADVATGTIGHVISGESPRMLAP